MTSELSPNGQHAESQVEPEPVNAYVDAVTQSRPPELVQFELNTDPYANMLPRVASVTSAGEGEADPARRRNPLLVAISLVLIAILILPVMAEVFARLIH